MSHFKYAYFIIVLFSLCSSWVKAEQITHTETEDVKFIEPESTEGEAVTKFLGSYRTLSQIAPDAYERQVNDAPVTSHDTSVGITVRADMDADTVYAITKAFWENIGSITSDAPWAKAISLEEAVKYQENMPLHEGARRYYEEVGAL